MSRDARQVHITILPMPFPASSHFISLLRLAERSQRAQHTPCSPHTSLTDHLSPLIIADATRAVLTHLLQPSAIEPPAFLSSNYIIRTTFVLLDQPS